MKGFRKLGTAQVLINHKGETVIDRRSLRRNDTRFDGDDDFGADDDLGDDETGDDDLGDDDLGARRKRRNRRNRNLRRSKKAVKKSRWGATVLAGSLTLAAAGSGTIAIRLQHRFRAKNIKATGLANSTITSIRFGDRLVLDVASGLDISLLSATATEMGILDSQTIEQGLDILVGVSLPAAGTVIVNLFGTKPVSC